MLQKNRNTVRRENTLKWTTNIKNLPYSVKHDAVRRGKRIPGIIAGGDTVCNADCVLRMPQKITVDFFRKK